MSDDQPNHVTSSGAIAPVTTEQELTMGLERAAALVKAARHHLSEGRTVELSALEGRVADLLILAERLRTEEAGQDQSTYSAATQQRFLSSLSDLLADLGELESQLRTMAHASGAGDPYGS